MDVIELKFLLKLLGHRPDYRAPLARLSLTSNTADRNRACRQLRDRGWIACSEEIVKFKTAPPGKALLKLDADTLPVSDIELKALKLAEKAYITGGQAKLPKSDRHAILNGLAERGLIQTETKIKDVWITEAGKSYLIQDYTPQGNATISLGMLGNYLQFLRQSETRTLPGSEPASPFEGSPVKPTDEQVLHLIQTLDHELGTENYLPLFHLRAKLQPPLSRDELDQALYRLQRQDQIELSSLQEAIAYTPAQIDAGIPQDIGGPLFFITVV